MQCNLSSLTISSSLKIIANTKINNSAVDLDIVYLKRDMNYNHIDIDTGKLIHDGWKMIIMQSLEKKVGHLL